jgi:hypothetical protein
MEIIDHGVWVQYQPVKPAKYAPHNTIYARREADSTDWYDYVRPDFLRMQPPPPPTYHPTTGELLPVPPIPPSNFKSGSVVCNIFRQRDQSIVGAATYDPTAVHSINQRVIEIVGYTGSDPQKDFGGKVYDHATGTFSDQPPPPPSLGARLDAMEQRIKALEARKK